MFVNNNSTSRFIYFFCTKTGFFFFYIHIPRPPLHNDTQGVSSAKVRPRFGPLTVSPVLVFFQTVIKELNRLGMIIDLSHSSHATSMDTIQAQQH
jgi:hypothetical protein